MKGDHRAFCSGNFKSIYVPELMPQPQLFAGLILRTGTYPSYLIWQRHSGELSRVFRCPSNLFPTWLYAGIKPGGEAC